MSHGIVPVCFSSSPIRESKEILNREKSEERFLSPQADAFAGANAEEKASACSVRNDGVGAEAKLAPRFVRASALMGGGKIGVTLRMRGELRAEIIAFAEREKRSLGGLIAILVEWSFEQLKAAGSTTKLFGQSAKRLNKLTSDKRLKHG